MDAIQEIDRQIEQLNAKLQVLRELRATLTGQAVAPYETSGEHSIGSPQLQRVIAILQQRGPLRCVQISKIMGYKTHQNVYGLLTRHPHLFSRSGHDPRVWELRRDTPTETPTKPQDSEGETC